MLKDGDIFGDGVNIAARLEGLADPGGIPISRGIHDHVMKKLPFDLKTLGSKASRTSPSPSGCSGSFSTGKDRAGGEPSRGRRRRPTEIPSLAEDAPAASTSDPQAVEIQLLGYPLRRTAPLGPNTKPISSNLSEAARRSCRVRLEAIKQDAVSMRDPHDGKLNCRFGSLSQSRRSPSWSRRTWKNIRR